MFTDTKHTAFRKYITVRVRSVIPFFLPKNTFKYLFYSLKSYSLFEFEPIGGMSQTVVWYTRRYIEVQHMVCKTNQQSTLQSGIIGWMWKRSKNIPHFSSEATNNRMSTAEEGEIGPATRI